MTWLALTAHLGLVPSQGPTAQPGLHQTDGGRISHTELQQTGKTRMTNSAGSSNKGSIHPRGLHVTGRRFIGLQASYQKAANSRDHNN